MAKWVTSPAYASAARLIVQERSKQGLTQRDLADRLGKPRSFVSKIESNERKVHVVEFVAIARALGADEREMFGQLLNELVGDIEL